MFWLENPFVHEHELFIRTPELFIGLRDRCDRGLVWISRVGVSHGNHWLSNVISIGRSGFLVDEARKTLTKAWLYDGECRPGIDH